MARRRIRGSCGPVFPMEMPIPATITLGSPGVVYWRTTLRPSASLATAASRFVFCGTARTGTSVFRSASSRRRWWRTDGYTFPPMRAALMSMDWHNGEESLLYQLAGDGDDAVRLRP